MGRFLGKRCKMVMRHHLMEADLYRHGHQDTERDGKLADLYRHGHQDSRQDGNSADEASVSPPTVFKTKVPRSVDSSKCREVPGQSWNQWNLFTNLYMSTSNLRFYAAVQLFFHFQVDSLSLCLSNPRS